MAQLALYFNVCVVDNGSISLLTLNIEECIKIENENMAFLWIRVCLLILCYTVLGDGPDNY